MLVFALGGTASRAASDSVALATAVPSGAACPAASRMPAFMETGFDFASFKDFATALLIGALIGIEREKHRTDAGHGGIGGVRTFILIAETGAIAGYLSRVFAAPWILGVALVAVTASVVAGYLRESHVAPDSVGLTTEVAALIACLLGGLTTLGFQGLAIGLGVVTAAVLAYKQPLHGLVDRLGWDDVFAGLRLLIATFIVLPLLPNRTLDPWGALNPYTIWLLVLLISGLSLVGYIATRWLGPDRGAALTGFTGGLVSSTAVTLSFARQSREERSHTVGVALASGILLSWCVMCVRVVIEVFVVNRALTWDVAVPFAVMGVTAAVLAWLFYWRGTTRKAHAQEATATEVGLKNPFSLTEAAKFALFFAIVMLVVKIVQSRFPGEGMYALAAIAGLTEVDAITLSMAEYAKTGGSDVAVRAIVIAALSNTAVKCGLVMFLGGPALKRPVLAATAVFVLAGLLSLAF
jgi:uncharacterized membrane protein (DUF4010 family)